MITNTLRATAALLGAIVLSVTLAGSPALADDDDRNSDPVIHSVTVDFDLETITIVGSGFVPRYWSPDPVVTLGDVPLDVKSATDTAIVANCPPIGGPPFCADGDFLLVVAPGGGFGDDDDNGGLKVAYAMTIGAVGLVGRVEHSRLVEREPSHRHDQRALENALIDVVLVFGDRGPRRTSKPTAGDIGIGMQSRSRDEMQQ